MNTNTTNMKGREIVYKELSYKLNGILFAAHNELGRYRNEKQYRDLIENLLKEMRISYEREKIAPKSFVSERAGRNKIDFVIDGKIILEVKAKRVLEREDYYQVMRYLQTLGIRLGILVNFRRQYLSPKRILSGYNNS